MRRQLSVMTALACLWFTVSTAMATPASPPTVPTGQIQNETAILAGGCFWCMEADFEKLPGVISVVSGYVGGHFDNPRYEQVSAGTTGHYEAVRITYDPARLTYKKLLDHFWLQVDPTVDDRQFCDVGSQYRSAIFYLNEAQKKIAETSKQTLEQSGRLRHVMPPVKVNSKSYPAEFQLEANRSADEEAASYGKTHPSGSVLTNILPATTFYPAEEYHQDYYKKNPIRYRVYRTQCGRDARLKHVWKKAGSITK